MYSWRVICADRYEWMGAHVMGCSLVELANQSASDAKKPCQICDMKSRQLARSLVVWVKTGRWNLKLMRLQMNLLAYDCACCSRSCLLMPILTGFLTMLWGVS